MKKNDCSENPLVSICCLAYNHESFIEKTLVGFINQKTSFTFEVLIHDDASTDKTPDIIKKYEEKYPDIIKPVYQKENQTSKGINVQKTYNYPRIKGKYVAYCEGDDYWCDENKLQLQVEVLMENENCTISTHITEKISKDGELLNSFFPPIPINKKILNLKDYLSSELLEKNWTFHLSSFMVKKVVIDTLMNDEVSFIKEFRRVGDFPLIVLALTRGDLAYIPRKMSCYRWMSGGYMTEWSNLMNKSLKLSISDSFIAGYNEIDKYTNYEYHKIFEYGILNCEFSKLIVLEEFKKVTSEKYKPIYKTLSKNKKLAIQIGKRSKKVYRLLLKFKTLIKS